MTTFSLPDTQKWSLLASLAVFTGAETETAVFTGAAERVITGAAEPV